MRNSFEHFQFLVQAKVVAASEDVDWVKRLGNKLIQMLYKPVMTDSMWVTDPERLKEYHLDEEPVNWGDLKVCDVERMESGYLVTIDEASPAQCPNLCQYISSHLIAWGWSVRVQTEW